MTKYLFPASIEEAIQLLEACPGEARIIAGGTDVLPDIRKRKIDPRRLIDITRIPGLDQINVTRDLVDPCGILHPSMCVRPTIRCADSHNELSQAGTRRRSACL